MDARLPMWQDGDPISAARLNAIQDAAQRTLSVGPGSGLELQSNVAGYTLRLRERAIARYAVVTSTIGAYTAGTSTLGSGTISLKYKDQAGVLHSFSTPNVRCYNMTANPVSVGTLIQAKWIDNDWCVDVVSC